MGLALANEACFKSKKNLPPVLWTPHQPLIFRSKYATIPTIPPRFRGGARVGVYQERLSDGSRGPLILVASVFLRPPKISANRRGEDVPMHEHDQMWEAYETLDYPNAPFVKPFWVDPAFLFSLMPNSSRSISLQTLTINLETRFAQHLYAFFNPSALSGGADWLSPHLRPRPLSAALRANTSDHFHAFAAL